MYGLPDLTYLAILPQIQPQHASHVGDVYATAFLARLYQSRHLDALDNCGLGPNRSKLRRLLSWVPNWSTTLEEKVEVLNCLYSGAGVSSAQALFYHPNIFEVACVPSGSVHVIKGSAPKG
jgi:hypothetical protein